MTPVEIKKQLIKEIITPFFKSNGFTKKGMKYFEVINCLTIEAWIQTLRYYKIENTDAFRIDIKIYPENVMPFASMYCFSIPINSSHITIEDNTDIDKLKTLIAKELNQFLEYLEKFRNAEIIIEEQRLEIEELQSKIIETKQKLKKETENQNLIYVLKNAIGLCEKNIGIKNNWIKIVTERNE